MYGCSTLFNMITELQHLHEFWIQSFIAICVKYESSHLLSRLSKKLEKQCIFLNLEHLL